MPFIGWKIIISTNAPVDWTILHAATDGDKAAIRELSALYLQQGVKNVKELRAAVEREKPEQVAQVAHRFLGSSRFFGAVPIGKPLEALLKMSRANRLGPAALQLIQRTEKEFTRIQRYFNAAR